MRMTERQLLHAIDVAQTQKDTEGAEYLQAMHEKYYGGFGLRKVTAYITTQETQEL
jgi:hypothetical protein